MPESGPDAAAVVAGYADWLPEDQAWLVAASALAARGVDGQDGLAVVVRDSVDRGHDPHRMRETLLQTLLFAGYPCALNALTVWHCVMEADAPVPLAEMESEKLEDDDPAGFAERGRVNAGQVYGRNLDRLMANASALSPDLAHWMIVDGYGRVLGRANLPFPLREACIVATLVPGRVERQLFSHIKGCLNVGLQPEQVRAVVELACEFAGTDAVALARRTLESVLARTGR